MASLHATKLRLIYERADRALKVAKQQKEDAWLAYMKQMRAEGFCPACEKTLQECRCVAMASASPGYPPPSFFARSFESVPETIYDTRCETSAAPDYSFKRVPESEGQVSAPITSMETAESPARQSGSPEVDPSGERQILPKEREDELLRAIQSEGRK
jgi:hypothetical protein